MPTSTQIDEAVTALLKVDDPGKAADLSQVELIRRVLAFANTRIPIDLPGASFRDIGGKRYFTYITEADEVGDALIDQLRRDLGAVVAGDLSAPAIARLQKTARHVIVREYKVVAGKLQRRDRHFSREVEQVCADVVLTIHTDDRLHDEVKRCRLPGCGKFFLVEDAMRVYGLDADAPGRRPHKYCSPEHMAAGQSSGAERTARWRASKARKPK